MSKGSDKAVVTYLIALTGIAIMCLGIALLLAIYNKDATGKVFAIGATAVGGLVAIGPTVMRRNGKENE